MPARRRKRKQEELPERFTPRFWRDADQRSAVVKTTRQQLQTLCEDAGVDCEQKHLIAQRAVFISLQLQTMEVEAATTGNFEAGTYTQMTNCLLGLLRSLGLKPAAKKTANLHEHIQNGDD